MFIIKPERVVYYKYLFDLRDSAICNMMESSMYLKRNFLKLDRRTSEEIAFEWMENCSEIEKAIKHQVDTAMDVDGDNDNNDEDSDNAEDEHVFSEQCYWNDTGKYQEEYNRLYKKYVPSSGAADTPQGNLLRVVSKISYRFYNDGDKSLDDHQRLLEESPIPDDVPSEFYHHFGIFDDDEDINKMIDIAVEYALEKEDTDPLA